MIEQKIVITGIEELQKKFNDFDTKKIFKRWIEKSLILLSNEAKKNTPVITWLLRASYETETNDLILEWKLRNYREYAPFVESRRWFLDKTYNENTSKVYKIFQDEIDNALKTSKLW
jgi:hypothetical protein